MNTLALVITSCETGLVTQTGSSLLTNANGEFPENIVLGGPNFLGNFFSMYSFNNPNQSCITPNGKILISDYFNDRVLIWNEIPNQNGAPPDLVLGQSGLYSSFPMVNPQATFTPNSVYSDGTRVIVSDESSNRVLIWNSFPTTNGQNADLVLGQPNFTSYASGTTQNTLSLPNGAATDGTHIVVADSGNNRVLIWNSFPTSNGQNADLVIGQTNFTSLASGITQNTLNNPFSVITDGKHLLIADTGNYRVLIWNSFPTTNGQNADLVIGQTNFTSNFSGTTQNSLFSPTGVAIDGTHIIVADTGNNRALIWNSFPTTNGQNADLVLGQENFTSKITYVNGTTQGNNFSPNGVSSNGTNLLVVDSLNNRVLLFDNIPTTNNAYANIVLGQTNFYSRVYNSNASLNQPTSAITDPLGRLIISDSNNGRLAIWNHFPTTNGQTPDLLFFGSTRQNNLGKPAYASSDGIHLLVADESNNRVLIWNSFPMTSNQPADLVLGQTDFSINFIGSPSASELLSPTSVFSDGSHVLVADSGNNRVMIWNSFPIVNGQNADLVLGQTNFTSNNCFTSQSAMCNPMGVYLKDSKILVGDTNNDRVLIWNSFPTVNGQNADLVLGQTNFSNQGILVMQNPQGVFSDGAQVLVANSNLFDVLIWHSFPTTNGKAPDQSFYMNSLVQNGLNYPSSVFFDGINYLIADTYNNRVLILKSL